MRIPRDLYDALKRIEANHGTTKEIEMNDIDRLQAAGLIVPANKHEQDYSFKITPRGREGLDDRPTELPNEREQP